MKMRFFNQSYQSIIMSVYIFRTYRYKFRLSYRSWVVVEWVDDKWTVSCFWVCAEDVVEIENETILRWIGLLLLLWNRWKMLSSDSFFEICLLFLFCDFLVSKISELLFIIYWFFWWRYILLSLNLLQEKFWIFPNNNLFHLQPFFT